VRNTHRSVISLQAGRWFKLIGGASYQHLPSIRNLALAYTLAGADCVDVAADPAVVNAVKEAFFVVSRLPQIPDFAGQLIGKIPSEPPLLMVSFSDGDDPHFRKATFDPQRCPQDCTRPCEPICPAAAIAFTPQAAGVLEDRCYGCGRCLPVCPIQQIETVTRPTQVSAIAASLLEQVDAIEIHTQVGRYDSFMALWSVLRSHLHQLSVVSISCPDQADAIAYLWQLYEGIQPLDLPLIWQTDGRPMSGDIGKGTTHATVRYAQKVMQSGPPGYVQLAGGTNDHTAAKLGTLATPAASASSATWLARWGQPAYPAPRLGGVAFGSFARRLLHPVLAEWSTEPLFASAVSSEARPSCHVPDSLSRSLSQLRQAVQLAQSLVSPIKGEFDGAVLPWTTWGDRDDSPAAITEPPLYSSLIE